MKDAARNTVVIEPVHKYGLGLAHSTNQVWKYRQLLLFLCWRDILIRYKRTYLGFSWLIIRPVLSTLILTFIFNRLAKLSVGSIDYTAYVLSGFLFWQFFSTFLSDSGNSLLTNSSLITKVYFPRILIPLSYLASNVIDFLATYILLLLVFIATGTHLTLNLLLIPFLLLWICAISIGSVMLYAPLVAKYRDIRYALPFFLQLLMFVSPIGYSQNLIKGGLSYLYYINPLTGVISFGRWLFFNESFSSTIFISIVVTILLFIGGIYYFQRQSSNLADDL